MPATYEERIARRCRFWWDAPRPGSGRTLRDSGHRLRERRTLHRRDESLETWRCCEFWPRLLADKWNAREYAARHGAPMPGLYWRGGWTSRPPVDSLPEHFVIRPTRGANREGVLVVAKGRDLLRGESATDAELRRKLSPWRRAARPVPILIEEFVRSEDGSYRPPLELKCHVFADTIAGVEVLERAALLAHTRRWYTPAWETFSDPMDTHIPQAELRDPPKGFEEMLALAARIGRELGTYMRIDFFASDRGCVFNEFSTAPRRGREYTPYCNEFLGAVWAEKCPDAI